MLYHLLYPLHDAWSLLNAIASGRTLGEIGATGEPANLSAVLPRCVQNGWIAGFELRPNP
jgi:hypothetical protein